MHITNKTESDFNATEVATPSKLITYLTTVSVFVLSLGFSESTEE